jgi:hypothetical protein
MLPSTISKRMVIMPRRKREAMILCRAWKVWLKQDHERNEFGLPRQSTPSHTRRLLA